MDDHSVFSLHLRRRKNSPAKRVCSKLYGKIRKVSDPIMMAASKMAVPLTIELFGFQSVLGAV